MAWDSNSIKNSLYSILGRDAARMDAGRAQKLEQVRTAMLECLDPVNAQEIPALRRRMAYAKDIQTLWYLRADLMGVLASHAGESAARIQLDQISPQFHGLLPKGLVPRARRLSD